MTPILVHAQPWDTATAARIDIRAASALERDAFGLGGQAWSPALVERPKFSVETMSTDISGRVLTGKAVLTLDLDATAISASRQIKWMGAPIKIYSAKTLDWPATIEFDGEVIDVSLDLDTRMLTLSCEVLTSLIEKPLLTAEFTGAGGATGDAEKRGTLKPAGFGICENIPPVWFDATNNIGMIDGYGNCTAITKLMEGASDMGARVADYANYAALAAAIVAHTVPPGRWASCVAEGLIGLGAPPVGTIGVNATFGSNRLGAMMSRIIQTHAGVAVGNVDTASFTALDTALNYPTHHWTDAQIDVKSLLETMARSGNATLLMTMQKKVAVSRAVASSSLATLDRSGKQLPRCIGWKALATQKPVWRLKARTARPAQVLTNDQVNYVDSIIDRGAYVGATVYRAGNLVWSADKSSWLYTNVLAGSGNAPPAWPTTSNAYWTNVAPPLNATDIGVAPGATADITLTANNANHQVGGNTVTKLVAGYNGVVYSAERAIGTGVLSFYATASALGPIGFATAQAAATPVYNDIAGVAFDNAAGSKFYIIGPAYASPQGPFTYAAGDRFDVALDGTVLRIFKNSAQVGTPVSVGSSPQYAKMAISSVSTVISGIQLQRSVVVWDSMVGTGLPDANATLGDNQVLNSTAEDPLNNAWWGNATRTAGNPASNEPAFFIRSTSAGGVGGSFNEGHLIAVTPGDTYYVSGQLRDATQATNNFWRFNPFFYKSDGTTLISNPIVDLPANSATFVTRKSTFTVPPGAAYMTLTDLGIVNTGASVDFAYPRFAKTELQADVTSLAQVAIEITTDKTIAADYTGALTGVLADIVWSAAVTRGGTSIKVLDGTTYAISNVTPTSGTTFAVDNTNGSSTKGQVTISAMSANTVTADLTITVDGIAQPKITLKLDKVLGAAPGGGGGSSSSVSWTSGEYTGINTTSYTPVVTAKTITVTSGQTLYGVAPLSFLVSGNGGVSRNMTAKWQYSPAGAGSWSDFGTGIGSIYAGVSALSGGYPDYEFIPPSEGYVEVTQSKAGLAAGDWDIRMVAIDDATGRICTLAGTATVTAS